MSLILEKNYSKSIHEIHSYMLYSETQLNLKKIYPIKNRIN